MYGPSRTSKQIGHCGAGVAPATVAAAAAAVGAAFDAAAVAPTYTAKGPAVSTISVGASSASTTIAPLSAIEMPPVETGMLKGAISAGTHAEGSVAGCHLFFLFSFCFSLQIFFSSSLQLFFFWVFLTLCHEDEVGFDDAWSSFACQFHELELAGMEPCQLG